FSIIACNDDFCGISSQVNDVPIGAGHTYYIIVDGFGGDCGDYDLQVTQGCSPPPPPPPPPSGGTYVWEFRSVFLDPRTGQSGIEGAAASIINGKIYVSHGFRAVDSFFLSIYDIASNSWTHGGSSAPNGSVVQSEMGGGTACGK